MQLKGLLCIIFRNGNVRQFKRKFREDIKLSFVMVDVSSLDVDLGGYLCPF
jgi:hypothetical protein